MLTLEHYNNRNGDTVQDNNWSMQTDDNFSNLSTGAPRDHLMVAITPPPVAASCCGMFIGQQQPG